MVIAAGAGQFQITLRFPTFTEGFAGLTVVFVLVLTAFSRSISINRMECSLLTVLFVTRRQVIDLREQFLLLSITLFDLVLLHFSNLFDVIFDLLEINKVRCIFKLSDFVYQI